MGRERSDKRARSAVARRSAATYLHQLAWLEGFPDGDGWQRLDSGERIELAGTLLARSRRAARTVMREYREALPGLVGDVDRWWQVVDAVLSWGSRRGALDLVDLAPPRIARAAREAARRPALREAVVAAGIAWALRPDVLERVIAWLVAHEHAAASFEPRTLLQLARLATAKQVGVAAGVDALLALLAIDVLDGQQALEVVASLINRVHGKRGEPAPAPKRSVPRVREWMERLGRCEADERGRALALLGAIDLAVAIEPWARWERDHAARLERAAVFADRDVDRDDEEHNIEGLDAALGQVRKSAPAAIDLDLALIEISMLASERLVRFHGPALRLLEAMPVPLPAVARPNMVIHLARIAASADDLRQAWLWDAVAAALERGDPRIFGPWESAIVTAAWSYLDDDVVAPIKTRAEVERTVNVLVRLVALPPNRITSTDAERAGAWIAAGLTDDVATEVIAKLRSANDELSVDVARAIIAIADGTAVDLADQGTLMLAATTDLQWNRTRELMKLVQHAVATGGTWLVRAALAAKQGAALANAAATIALLPRPRWPPVTIACLPATACLPVSWIDRYPAALAPALRRLASVDPDAEHTAARRLANDLPDPAALRREIDALRERAPSGAKRLANLEARLAAPKPPSPARLARLASKLDHTATALGLARLGEAVTTAAAERLVRSFALPAPPAWQLDRHARQALFATLQLDEADRALVGRLLRARMGPPPWDLRDDAVNVAFLDQLRSRGVAVEPWLDDAPRIVLAADGKPVELALCGDPLEVFAMGAHFDTCLAPDGGNFFSVVANAADVNKRVLYARRDGAVVGRCLLAITDSNAVLAFQPYCHDNAIEFHAVARDYALDLAARMQTTLAAQGGVSNLLARDWYDDGPRDLAGRFSGLDAIRDELETIEPGALVAKLREALGHALDDLTLPVVLGLIAARPQLVIPLAPHLLATTTPATRIRAAELAMHAGELALADRLLAEHGKAIRIEHFAWPAGEVLAQLRPSLALARLRETRHRTVRRLVDDSGDRIAVAGVALEALHRTRQAIALYQLALQRDSHLRHDLHSRLRRLGALTSP